MTRRLWTVVSATVVLASVASAVFGPAGDEFHVTEAPSNFTASPAVCTRPDGGWVVAFEAPDADQDGIFGRVYTAGGAPVGPTFPVSSTATGVEQTPAVCCGSAGDFVVAWEGPEGPMFPGIFAQRFDANAARVGTEFQVNTYTTYGQFETSIACGPDGRFLVVWASDMFDGTLGIAARLFASTGLPSGPDFLVNTYTTFTQRDPNVAAVGDGFVVVWKSNKQDGDSYGIFGQRLLSDGSRAGGEFQVNEYTTNGQRYGRVAGNPDGSFVVAWADISSDDVKARRFSSSGAPNLSEFVVNSYTTGPQHPPSVAMDRTGAFVVTWLDESGLDGDRSGVFGQRYDSAGSKIGDNFQVNTYTTGDQGYIRSPVAMDPDGDFLVVWDGAAGGVAGDILGRIFRDPCGDGVVGPGEACDDGSRLPGDCCDATCQPVARGTTCDGADATSCSACDGAGVCAPGTLACLACSHCAAGAGCVVGPRTDCRRPTKARRALLNVANRGKDKRDAFLFSWSKGAATAAGDFGNPLGADDVDVCLWDATNRVLFNATAPAAGTCKGKPCWKARGAKGFRYRDKEATPGGLTRVDLGAGAAGKASLVVKGRGANLHLGPLGATPPLTAEVDTGGACFAGTFAAPRPNSATRLKAKGN